MKDMKIGRHPAIKIALVSAVLTAIVGTLLLKLSPIEISISSSSPETVPVIKSANSPAESAAPPDLEPPNAAVPKPGNLRIRNRSDHPVRVALLSRQPKQTNAKSGEPPKGFAPPAHWDFAPQEGSDSGLLVALPNRSIQLKRGDVVVAFAQDGSERYWGPFVVGETDRPDWNAQAAEWELILDD